MRKILINKKGEFKRIGKYNYLRAFAIKKVASAIKEPEQNTEDEVVIIDNRAQIAKTA